MGERQQRLTLPKQKCMGVARQPMKISGLFSEQGGSINYDE
jgi:hypothetical protein